MSNEPIFQKLAREYALSGKSYERMISPHLSPVRPLGSSVEPQTNIEAYEPNEYLDGPYKAPLPKRTLAHFITLPEPDPTVVEQIQEIVSNISKAPQMVLQGPAIYETRIPAPTGLLAFKDVEGEHEIRANTIRSNMQNYVDQMEAHHGPWIVDETMRFQETGKLDETMSMGIVTTAEAVDRHIPPATYEDVIEVANQYGSIVVTKIVSAEDLVDGITSADIIEELGKEFAEKYPNAAVNEVNVGEDFFGRMIIKVRGVLIHEEENETYIRHTHDKDGVRYVDRVEEIGEKTEKLYESALRAMAQYGNPEQTDESVNAASNEENDDENEPVFVAPAFWKIRDEE